MEESSISLEETNRIRLSIGLKPLTEDDNNNDEKDAFERYKKIKEDEKKELESQKLRNKVEKSKNKLKLNEKLKGNTIADDIKDVSALEWVKRSKILRNNQKLTINYDALDETLSNKSNNENIEISVQHDIEDFKEGEESILILKDSNVLDDENDELVSVHLQDKEKLQENLDNRKRKRAYNAYDEQYEEDVIGKKRNILSQYDDKEQKKPGFSINSSRSFVVNKQDDQSQSNNPYKSDVSLLGEEMQKIHDYYTKEEADIQFKKPKKKSKKFRKRESEISSVAMEEVEFQQIPVDMGRVNFVDDNELQSSLAKARRKNMVRSRVLTDEDLARQISNTRPDVIESNEDQLLFSDTTEFVSIFSQNKNDKSYEHFIETENANQKDEEKDIEELTDDEKEGGIEQEPLVSSGMAATLALLKKKGMYHQPSQEELERDKVQRERQNYSNKIDQNTNKTKVSKQNEFDKMASYKPGFKLEYVDSKGVPMEPKEAFRSLSHRFHGVKPGKNKTEKRQKKKEEKKKLDGLI